MIYQKFFAETKTRRKLEFRIDCIGIYLNAYGMMEDVWADEEGIMVETLIAGISYQWPCWLARKLGDKETQPGWFVRNSFQLWNGYY
jgi:hypothetical protein